MANISNWTTSANSTEIADDDAADEVIANRIWIYAGTFLLLLGTFGNVMSVLVVMRKRLRGHTMSLYLVVLAVVDTAVLYNGLARYWILALTDVDIRLISVTSCKTQTFFAYFLVHFEAWMLVWVSLERLVATFVPHRAKDVFTQNFAAVQVASTGIILMSINLHFFWTHTLLGRHCVLSDDKYRYFADVWKWLDFVLSSLAPFVLMMLFNVAIITRLYCMKRNKKDATNSANRRLNTMTGTLLTVSFVFFFTTAPIAFLLRREHHDPIEDGQTDKVLWAAVNILAYTNNAVNFILYCVSGPMFRRELVRMIRFGFYPAKVQPQIVSIPVAEYPPTLTSTPLKDD